MDITRRSDKVIYRTCNFYSRIIIELRLCLRLLVSARVGLVLIGFNSRYLYSRANSKLLVLLRYSIN